MNPISKLKHRLLFYALLLLAIYPSVCRAQLPAGMLKPEQAHEGWIALFDGKTTFGFQDAQLSVTDQVATLKGGRTTTEFAGYEIRVGVAEAGDITLGEERLSLAVGTHEVSSRGKRGVITLSPELAVTSLLLRPVALKPLFNGRDFTNWDRRGRVPAGKNPGAKWTVEKGVIHVSGGPEALEFAPSEGPHMFADFLLQVVVRSRRPGTNGGLFFRNEPGRTMMGYEAQLHNTWYDPQSDKHGYTTGGIDDRQQARAPIAKDEIPFRMTVVAHGAHIATWVDGYQTVDWTDSRSADLNPRRGLRMEPGTIQLQAHDPETDLEFHGIWLQEL